MKVKVVKNPCTRTVTKEGKRVPYGWMVFPVVKYGGYWELDECPLHNWGNPFKTKKNAIKAVKNGRFTTVSCAELNSILAFSAASRNRCETILSLDTSIPESALNSSTR